MKVRQCKESQTQFMSTEQTASNQGQIFIAGTQNF